MQGSKAEDGGNCRLDRMNADLLGSGNCLGGSILLAIIIPTISFFFSFEAAHECRYVRCVAAAEQSKTGPHVSGWQPKRLTILIASVLRGLVFPG